VYKAGPATAASWDAWEQAFTLQGARPVQGWMYVCGEPSSSSRCADN
jgi:hypothetical protein